MPFGDACRLDTHSDLLYLKEISEYVKILLFKNGSTEYFFSEKLPAIFCKHVKDCGQIILLSTDERSYHHGASYTFLILRRSWPWKN